MEEKRTKDRIDLPLVTYIREKKDDGYVIHQFLTKNLSETGLFICADNRALFQLGDDLEIMVDDKEKKYYEGKAKVVRSAKIFTDDDTPTESGFGLLLTETNQEYGALIKKAASADKTT